MPHIKQILNVMIGMVYTLHIIIMHYPYSKLISLDLWRCKFASRETINILANYCQDLQELDMGWW